MILFGRIWLEREQKVFECIKFEIRLLKLTEYAEVQKQSIM